MAISLMNMEHLEAINQIDIRTNISPWSKDNLQSSLEVGHHGLVSTKDKTITGFIIFSPMPPECHILTIAIDTKFQRSGIGTLLLNKAIDQSKAMKIRKIFLEVRLSNETAINFYKSFGFIKDAIRDKYYPGNPREDALLMSLSI